jgi:putative mycofactocin binding protein MftB
MPLTLDRPYRVDSQVALRPEPFGALAYHYGNRRLTFLRSPDMVRVVEGLNDAESVAEALEGAGIARPRWPSFVKALTALEASEVIHAR